MVGLEYKSLNVNLVIGFICGVLGFLNYLNLGNIGWINWIRTSIKGCNAYNINEFNTLNWNDCKNLDEKTDQIH